MQTTLLFIRSYLCGFLPSSDVLHSSGLVYDGLIKINGTTWSGQVSLKSRTMINNVRVVQFNIFAVFKIKLVSVEAHITGPFTKNVAMSNRTSAKIAPPFLLKK